MPAVNRIPKKTVTYGVRLEAGTNTPETSVRVAAGNPERTMLLIQNTGANDGLVRFGGPILGDGTDILFTAGSGLLWDREMTCPESSMDFGSALGTTFTITEQVTR